MKQTKFKYKWKGEWYFIDLYEDNTAEKFAEYESRNKTTRFRQFTNILDSKKNEIYDRSLIIVRNWGGSQEILCKAIVLWDVDEKAWNWQNLETGSYSSADGEIDNYDRWRNVEVYKHADDEN